MPLNFAGDTAVADGACLVEDALLLLEFLHAHGDAQVDLEACSHVHTAVLQVLLAARPRVVALPREPFLARWLPQALGLVGGAGAAEPGTQITMATKDT